MNADKGTQMYADKRGWVARALGMVLMAGVALSSFAGTPVPGGKWSWTFVDKKGRADRPLKIYTYRPRLCDSSCPIVFVLAGRNRNASAYRDQWELLADHNKFMVIAPEFSKEAWPKAAAYNQGDVAGQEDREKWAFSAIEHIFDEMRVDQKDYRVFGHGAGGQFVQRMALFRPDSRASLMVAANPGWYTMPEWRADKGAGAYPYSLAGSKAGERELRQALARRFVLMVGEKDEEPDDENLAQSDGAKKQGDSSVDRGETFIKAATAAAGDLGVKLAWELVEVPSAGSISKMASDTLGKK
jgi:pimeloyl-ACP methyl ester carboxylesterase